MKVVVLIPARGGSKGIPRKNLVLCAGKPLVLWSIEQALAADIGPVVVATDDADIAQVAATGGAVVYTEPPNVAADSISMEEVMRWFIGQYTHPTGALWDWLMVLQPTSPLKLASHLREVAAIAKTNAFDSIFSVVKSAHCSWRLSSGGLQAEWPQSLGDPPRRRILRQGASQQVTENGAIYCVNVERFLKNGTRFCGKLCPYEMPSWTAWEIDTPEDLALVEVIMRTRLRLGGDGVRS